MGWTRRLLPLFLVWVSAISGAQRPPIEWMTGDHARDISGLAVSHDGSFYASCAFDKVIKIWDNSTNKLIRTLAPDLGYIYEVDISSDDKYLAAAAFESGVLFDVQTGSLVNVFTGHTNAVQCISLSPNGQYIASGSVDKSFRVYSTLTGLNIYAESVSSNVSAVKILPDNQTVLANYGNVIAITNFLTGNTRVIGGGTVLDTSPDGSMVAYDVGSTVAIVRISDGQVLATLTGHTDEVTAIKFSHSGQKIATGSQDRTVRVWDIATGTLLQTMSGAGSTIAGIGFSPDDSTVTAAASYSDGLFRKWDTASGTPLYVSAGHWDQVYAVAASSDPRFVVSAARDGTIKAWKTSDGSLISTMGGIKGVSWTSVAVGPASAGHSDAVVVSGSIKGAIYFWNLSNGGLIKSFPAESIVVNAVSISPTGTNVATGGFDNVVRIWTVPGGSLVRTLGSTSSIWSVAYNPTGKWIAGGDGDGKVRVWDATSGLTVQTLSVGGEVTGVAWSADGKYLGACSRNGTALVWRTADFQGVGSFSPGIVALAISFAVSEPIVVVVGFPNSLAFYDFAAGRVVSSYNDETWQSDAVTYTRDGRHVFLGRLDGTCVFMRDPFALRPVGNVAGK